MTHLVVLPRVWCRCEPARDHQSGDTLKTQCHSSSSSQQACAPECEDENTRGRIVYGWSERKAHHSHLLSSPKSSKQLVSNGWSARSRITWRRRITFRPRWQSFVA